MKLLRRKTGASWTQGAVMYQIYPRSFQDGNGDGVGDLPGVIERLGYLQHLGVSGIWLSPFYPSPMADFGYDISDYRDVDPLFGTLQDFKRLLAEAHRRDIKVIIDIVPNHTSDEHEWFKESKKSRNNPRADWYIWHDPAGFDKDKKPLPPNNWLDIFAGRSAWQWEPARQQFYLHTFHVRQPDLNWRNPAVRKAIKDMLRYWLEMGVDGFRVDAVPFLAKDPQFRDDPPNPDYNPKLNTPYKRLIPENSSRWPEHYQYLREMSEVLKEKRFAAGGARFMVTEGEVDRRDVIGSYLSYARAMDPAIAAPFIFEGIKRPWNARDWRTFLGDFHTAMAAYSPLAQGSYAVSNHDQHRLVTKLGPDRARAAAVLEMTLPGVIFVYYGEELGMHNVQIPAAKIHDPQAAGGAGRDGERTPMQWSAAAENAGFSDTNAEPWLPVSRDYRRHDVGAESAQPDSFLSLYRRLIHLRNASASLRHGTMRVMPAPLHSELLAFVREHGRPGKPGHERYTTVVNFADKPLDYHFDQAGHVALSSLTVRPGHTVRRTSLRLKPYEAVLIRHG